MTTKVPVDLRRFTVFFVDVVKTGGGEILLVHAQLAVKLIG